MVLAALVMLSIQEKTIEISCPGTNVSARNILLYALFLFLFLFDNLELKQHFPKKERQISGSLIIQPRFIEEANTCIYA
jgi:hypothetical protein